MRTHILASLFHPNRYWSKPAHAHGVGSRGCVTRCKRVGGGREDITRQSRTSSSGIGGYKGSRRKSKGRERAGWSGRMDGWRVDEKGRIWGNRSVSFTANGQGYDMSCGIQLIITSQEGRRCDWQWATAGPSSVPQRTPSHRPPLKEEKKKGNKI